MDTLPLPPRPSLEQYRKRAKELVAAARSRDANTLDALTARWQTSPAALPGVSLTPFVRESIERALANIASRTRAKGSAFALSDAQFLIAHAHGFGSWAAFARHVERLSGGRGSGDEFEAGADAVVGGGIDALRSLLRSNPQLTRARSARVHHATLLHYVAANGVEDFRQKTPPNAAAVATLLLEQGAEVDALADTYGGGWWQTTMNLLVSSEHPAQAGVQCALVDVLLDFGAAINGTRDDASPLMTALHFGYPLAAETLVRRGARVDNVVAAAALGRTDLLDGYVVDRNTLAPKVPLVAPPWMRMPNEPRKHLELALLWACRYGRTGAAGLLLERGVDPAAKDVDDMTALHVASANGHMDIMRLLLDRGAPLEARNRWGGTVLGSTAYFAMYGPVKGVDYSAVMKMLLAAGAHAAAAFPTGNENIDDILGPRVHGGG